jgi:hypothetical protein
VTTICPSAQPIKRHDHLKEAEETGNFEVFSPHHFLEMNAAGEGCCKSVKRESDSDQEDGKHGWDATI